MNRQQYAHLPTDVLNLIVGRMLAFTEEYDDDITMMFWHLKILGFKTLVLPPHAEGKYWGRAHICSNGKYIESEIWIHKTPTTKSQAIILGHEVGHVIIDTSPNFCAHRLRSKFTGDDLHAYGVILEEIVETFAVKWVTKRGVYEQIVTLLESFKKTGEVTAYVSGYCRMPEWA